MNAFYFLHQQATKPRRGPVLSTILRLTLCGCVFFALISENIFTAPKTLRAIASQFVPMTGLTLLYADTSTVD